MRLYVQKGEILKALSTGNPGLLKKLTLKE